MIYHKRRPSSWSYFSFGNKVVAAAAVYLAITKRGAIETQTNLKQKKIGKNNANDGVIGREVTKRASCKMYSLGTAVLRQILVK